MPALHVQEVILILEELAPLALAQDWDNVGLLLGDSEAEVARVMTCLTVTPEVAAEAIAERVDLIVSHHPILFQPVQHLTTTDPQGRMLLDLIVAGVAVYSPHTAYDDAAGGINDQMAAALGLRDVAPLRVADSSAPSSQYKLVTFVPEVDCDVVARALFDAGAGEIGEYRECSFRTPGTGTFFGTESANPAVGEKGRREEVAEFRLEVVCPRRELADVLTALRQSHPYEEPASDVYPLVPDPAGLGSGRCGTLKSARTVADLAAQIKQVLHVQQLAVVGELNREITKIAIVCGAGGSFLDDAVGAGCDCLLTGEARFHSYLEAQSKDIALILPGHYATERFAVERLAEMLAERFLELTIWPSRSELDPVVWR